MAMESLQQIDSLWDGDQSAAVRALTVSLFWALNRRFVCRQEAKESFQRLDLFRRSGFPGFENSFLEGLKIHNGNKVRFRAGHAPLTHEQAQTLLDANGLSWSQCPQLGAGCYRGPLRPAISEPGGKQ